MELLELSDDALTYVLQYVDAEDLLRCRTVCRRLRVLSLTPPVWQHRRFGDGGKWTLRRQSTKTLGGVLRLAPRASELRMSSEGALLHLGVLAATTDCAASSLRLTISEDAALGALVILRQASLGRLKSLHLYINATMARAPQVADLLSVACHVEGLESLEIRMSSATSTILVGNIHYESAPSLKSLTYHASKIGQMLTSLLCQHSPTLEAVCLKGTKKCSVAVMQQIAALPALRSAAVPVSPGVDLLLECPGLVELTLDLMTPLDTTAHSLRGLEDAEKLLRDAVHLKTVKVMYHEEGAGDREYRLVKSLAATGRSEVRHLKLWFEDYLSSPVVHALSALPGLPNLATLELSTWPRDDFWAAVNPAVAPSLTNLVLYGPEGCNHSSIVHNGKAGRRVRDLLRRNPRLHVTLAFYSCIVPNAACTFCDQHRCHEEVLGMGAAGRLVGFHDHEDTAARACEVCKETASVWLRLTDD